MKCVCGKRAPSAPCGAIFAQFGCLRPELVTKPRRAVQSEDHPVNKTREPRVLVMTATYNERENLPGLSAEVFETLPDVHLLVVDDNSPDGTGKWAAEQVARDDRFHAIHRIGK